MAKSTLFSNPAFQQHSTPQVGFNLVNQTNSFNAMFDMKPLEQFEVNKIEELLTDHFQPALISEDQIEKDTDQIKNLTAEIKAIGRQGLILMGERILKARDILKSYRYGAFTKWLELTFGSRKTGYNMLAYYELYSSLPNDLKENFKKIPQKVAYILASKTGELQRKIELIQEYRDLSSDEMISLIQERFSPLTKSKRSDGNSKLIVSMYETINKLRKRKNYLSDIQKQDLSRLKEIINVILDVSLV